MNHCVINHTKGTQENAHIFLSYWKLYHGMLILLYNLHGKIEWELFDGMQMVWQKNVICIKEYAFCYKICGSLNENCMM